MSFQASLDLFSSNLEFLEWLKRDRTRHILGTLMQEGWLKPGHRTHYVYGHLPYDRGYDHRVAIYLTQSAYDGCFTLKSWFASKREEGLNPLTPKWKILKKLYDRWVRQH